MLKQCFYVISQRKIFEIEAFDRYYEGRNVTVVASRNIEAGEEIENCYGVDWRQGSFLDLIYVYYFINSKSYPTCECPENNINL